MINYGKSRGQGFCPGQGLNPVPPSSQQVVIAMSFNNPLVENTLFDFVILIQRDWKIHIVIIEKFPGATFPDTIVNRILGDTHPTLPAYKFADL